MMKNMNVFPFGVIVAATECPEIPDFVGIIPILLENPKSQPICDWDRKNPDFDSCSDIFIKFS